MARIRSDGRQSRDRREGWPSLLARLLRDRRGNVMVLIAAAMFPLLAMIGSAVDMGRLYLVQARLQSACDAGVLAARKAVSAYPNFVPARDSGPIVARGTQMFKANFPDGFQAAGNLRFTLTVGPDLAVDADAAIDEPTTLMSLFGIRSVPLAAHCQSQLTVSNTDIMLAVDVTGSMNETLDGDTQSKIAVVRQVLKDFWSQLEAGKVPGSRIRYGFVPYSTNVNVGALLKDEWVVPQWSYQSRIAIDTTNVGTYSYYTGISPVSGISSDNIDQSEPATFDPLTGALNCKKLAIPPATVTTSYVKTGSTTQAFVGPPAGTRTIDTYQRTRNGNTYNVTQSGNLCQLHKITYTNYVDTFGYVTDPTLTKGSQWDYQPITVSTAGWRAAANGCMEERDTYEIDDYTNVDLSKALDLDINRVPDPAKPATQWRPEYPDMIFDRQVMWDGSGSFDTHERKTTDEYVAPLVGGFAACPPPAKKLQTWLAADLDAYLATLVAGGSTYHDIGMIWAARLLTPAGLFAAENADVSATNPTKRNIVFLTDGQTAPLDLSYGAYGVEPLDQRRWSDKSKASLTETVENRFTYACNAAKKQNITVWLIAFGTKLNPIMADCAGPGHAFAAANAADLSTAFGKIAGGVGSLRIAR